MRELTTTQAAVWHYVQTHLRAPSNGMTAMHFGWRSKNSATIHLQALVDAGLLRKDDLGALVVVPSGETAGMTELERLKELVLARAAAFCSAKLALATECGDGEGMRHHLAEMNSNLLALRDLRTEVGEREGGCYFMAAGAAAASTRSAGEGMPSA